MPADVYEKIFQVAKRRGFLYPSFEIYGGSAGFYDYGPLGAGLKANMENLWRRFYVTREGCAEINCPNVTPEDVFIASGHVGEFTDPMVRCESCGAPFRADHLIEEADESVRFDVSDTADIDAKIAALGIKCLTCGGPVGASYHQNLMFQTEIGPGTRKKGYLRPETAQGIFMDFGHLYRYFREKLPFGVVQLGKGFRNEISPRQGMIRLREFNMMEAEVFVDPADGKSHPDFDAVRDTPMVMVPNATGEPLETTIGKAVDDGMVCNSALGYYMALTQEYLMAVGLDPKRVRFRQHLVTEMAHYANDCWDAEFHSDRFGWVECVGVADRSAFDLTAHETHSKVELRALRRYDEPREVTKTIVFPITKVLGPLFKGKAKAVAEGLRALDAADVTAGGPLSLEVDGETVEVPADAYEVKEQTEKLSGESFTPHVIEPSYGLDRILYAVLEHNYAEEDPDAKADADGDGEGGDSDVEGEGGGDSDAGAYRRFSFPAAVAPIKVGVFPLVNKEGLPDEARRIDRALRTAGITTYYDDSGTVGRRYARQDEIGTPFCVTVDFDTFRDGDAKGTVTIRDRDTRAQERVAIEELVGWVQARL